MDGGGIAAASRLLLAATRGWAERRGIRLRVLTLGGAHELPAGIDGAAFAGDRRRLATAVWRAQLGGYGLHLYDHLGMARIQGLLPRPLRARYLLYLWGLECWRPLRGTRRAAVDGAAIRLACSRFTVEQLQRHNPLARPVTVVPLALSDERPGGEPDRALLADLPDPFLLIVGRMAPGERYKGHDDLLAALARLAGSHPALGLVIAGEGGDRARLEALAASLGVAARVRFTGFVSAATLAELYRRCAAFVMPSSGEGFGLVYLEAMREGKPCVARADSAAAEIVEDGVTGRLVAPGPGALAAAIDELFAAPQTARAMGAAGSERWRRDFHGEGFTTRIHLHLDALLADHGDRAHPPGPPALDTLVATSADYRQAARRPGG
jgi:phosphatidylinositol alpha-1,6-mannosyltransferase